jgi:hypothetical protein
LKRITVEVYLSLEEAIPAAEQQGQQLWEA